VNIKGHERFKGYFSGIARSNDSWPSKILGAIVFKKKSPGAFPRVSPPFSSPLWPQVRYGFEY